MPKAVFPGADENSPSRAQYFSWINNTNEGATESQTLANLAFFKYLHDEFGMVLDIYAFDAGAIDGAKFYGSTDSERFHRQFPRGFQPLYLAAKNIGIRLGIWGGPDGFGTTEQEARQRIEMMTALCRDFQFALFKFDEVCGKLPAENRRHFVEMMTQCRRYSPDLILLNHRLELGEGMPHATTFLWQGAETYIDVHMSNPACAPHNRAVAIARGLPPDLKRLCEDHGVCLSSCLDYWEDDLILQAFNRCLILAPEIYGNPWLLRDDELPRLARIYNLHRRFRAILVNGMLLPEARFGPHAVSRGDDHTRLITLRNLTWETVRYSIPLDATIGLLHDTPVEFRRLHPHERVLGSFAYGTSVQVDVLPFRACLLIASTAMIEEIAIKGCDYDVLCDLPAKPVVVDLLGLPGTSANIQIPPGLTSFTLDGQPLANPPATIPVQFDGSPLLSNWHRKIADLQQTPVPDDAQALYEATIFAADNNALEVRELRRSGPSQLPVVQAARDAFFSQPLLRQRNLWDRNLFDDDPDTAFAISRRRAEDPRIRTACFRLDFGQPIQLDRLVLEIGHEHFLAPLKLQEAVTGSVSADLRQWTQVRGFVNGNVELQIPPGQPVRYFRLDDSPELVRHARGYLGGQPLDRSLWRASNLFASYRSAPAQHAWSARFTLDQIAGGSYLALAIHGDHGDELACAAIRTPSGYLGAPRRAPSYRSNTWEYSVRHATANTTWFFPLQPHMAGLTMEAFAMILKGGNSQVRPELYITAYPIPFVSRRLVLQRK